MKFYILCSYNCDVRHKKQTESANTAAFLVLSYLMILQNHTGSCPRFCSILLDTAWIMFIILWEILQDYVQDLMQDTLHDLKIL